MGQLIIYAAFFFALISSVLYFYSYYRKEKFLKKARFFFHASVVMTIISSAYLLYLIITHQFQYTYIWSYSSTELPFNLLLSSFYAGQEGSFHLWGLFTAILGIFLLSFLIKKDIINKERFEPLVMGVFVLIQAFILFALIIKSPYIYIWESFPNDVELGFLPVDGRGLNPILQNFWMSIHPPILFVGFAALSIPFSFAIAALMRNEYVKWLKLVMPWVLFGAMTLGAGIMIGGYWAYEVLGWGGYWGWDPVENASLVPWILIVAAIHTMTSEMRTNRYKKTSLFLSIVAFLMVLYSTFLTRSGILGDASVHSFVDPGNQVYLYLVIFISIFGAGGIGLLFMRAKDLKPISETSNLLSRESALFIGAVTLCASALVIAVGTSFPIFATGTIEPDFYNRMNLPVAIIIAFINGASLLLKWKNTNQSEFIKSLYLPLAISLVITIALVFFGMNDPLMGILAGGSLFALIINAELAYKLFRKNKYKAGPYIAHLGLMVLFLGIIGSSKYSEEVNVSLPLNQTKEALGYELTYKGASPVPGDVEKYHFNVVVKKDDKSFLLQPVMYYSDYSEGIIKNPDIANLIFKDFYIAPMALEVPGAFERDDLVTLEKGNEVDFKDIRIKFTEFDRSKFDETDMADGHDINIEAMIEVTIDGKTEKLSVKQIVTHNTPEYVPVFIEGNERYTFFLESISVNDDPEITVAVIDNFESAKMDQASETFVLTASIKPFINLVWGGTILILLGFIFSMIMRFKTKSAVNIKDMMKYKKPGNGSGTGDGNFKALNLNRNKPIKIVRKKESVE
jgi:cytochrome c-type biogenesis protein CcmF